MPVISVSGHSGEVSKRLESIAEKLVMICASADIPGVDQQSVEIVNGGPSLLPKSHFLVVQVLMRREDCHTDEHGTNLVALLASAVALLIPNDWHAMVRLEWHEPADQLITRVRGTVSVPSQG